MATRKTTSLTPARAPAKRARTKAGSPTAPKKVKPTAAAPETLLAGKKPPKTRIRLIRDSFTMPESDFALIASLKSRALTARRDAKKSELLRAGLQVLAALDSKALVDTLARLAPVKVGRPKKGA